jgi:hypothetical protein
MAYNQARLCDAESEVLVNPLPFLDEEVRRWYFWEHQVRLLYLGQHRGGVSGLPLSYMIPAARTQAMIRW